MAPWSQLDAPSRCIHLVTARTAATAFSTNDQRVHSQPGLKVHCLDDLELDSPQP